MDENTKGKILHLTKSFFTKNMVDAKKRTGFTNLPQWDKIFTPEKKKRALHGTEKNLVTNRKKAQ